MAPSLQIGLRRATNDDFPSSRHCGSPRRRSCDYGPGSGAHRSCPSGFRAPRRGRGRQAALIAEALGRIGVARFVLLGHSLGGAVASALALAFPARVAGLVLLAPVTHPWEGGLAWYNAILSTPVIGPLFAHTVALPLSVFL